jgi:hypothetical protein
LSSLPVAIVVFVVSCRAVARRAVAIIVAHRAFAIIIVDNGETSAYRRMKVAVDGVFFWLTGVGGDGRRHHASNDGGGDVQRTTAETTRSK